MVDQILTQLERISFALQHGYMKRKITRERVSPHYAFFHPRPTGQIVLDLYRQRLKNPTTKVLVTGCFDVLHSEHLKFLKAAQKAGSQLLVGVETDSRVRSLKGSGRPINSLQKRLKNLRQQGIADKVFALPNNFATTAQHRALIKRIRPDILAVSSHTPNLPLKRQLMHEIGGQLKIVLPHNPKISTTKLLQSKQ